MRLAKRSQSRGGIREHYLIFLLLITLVPFRDLEGLITKGAFSESGGLQHSNLIEKSLVDHFVPFLPIERMHVKQCILVEAGNHLGKYQLTEKVHRRQYVICRQLLVSRGLVVL